VPDISIIIPTLNEETALAPTLNALTRLTGAIEVIVVDGGSEDRTEALAKEHGARVLTSERGRGAQMHTGAQAARCQVLWFLHADTLVPADAVDHIHKALSDSAVVGGNFRLRFDGRRWASRFHTSLQPIFGWLGLVYGDSAIFVRRADYEQVGGFKPYPLFEDLDLVRRLRRRGRMDRVPASVVTSSRRFEKKSYTLTLARWVSLQMLYWLGFSPNWLIRHYAPIRGK
jgi:rSAM/selenodomain-associated transferase 2